MEQDINPEEGQVPAEGQDDVIPETPKPAGQTPVEEEFDKDRALATIRKLRGFEKHATGLERELAEYKRREQEAEAAKLSEQERLTKRAADLETQLQQERKTAQDQANRYEVERQAGKLGIVDPEAAVKLLDWQSLEYSEDGRPQDVDRALQDLLTDKPYLAAASQRSQGAANNPATRTTAPGQRVYTAAELSDRDFYVEHREDIQLAYRQGRVRA